MPHDFGGVGGSGGSGSDSGGGGSRRGRSASAMTPLSAAPVQPASARAAAGQGMAPMNPPPTRPAPLAPMQPPVGNTARPAMGMLPTPSGPTPMNMGTSPPRAFMPAAHGSAGPAPHAAQASASFAPPAKPALPQGASPLSPMPASYRAASDKTLTSAQAAAGGFRPVGTEKVIQAQPVTEAEIRYPSNPTAGPYNTGYHESFVTTDTMRFVSNRTVNKDGTATLPPWSSNTVLPQYSGVRIREENVRHVAEAGDGARTDTAQTVLSVPGGGAAGHTGSGVRTTGQAAGHNFARHQSMRALSVDGMTPGVAGVFAGAVSVMSMAPGQSASAAEGAGKLKATQVQAEYEARRNQAKLKLEPHFAALPPQQQATVMSMASQSMSDLNDSSRHLLPGRPYSPLRDPGRQPGAALGGGAYRPVLTTPTPAAPGFPVLPAGTSSNALLAPMAQRPSPGGTPAVPGPAGTLAPMGGAGHAFAPRPAGTAAASAATTPAPGPGLGARAIAMDITSPFRSERKGK